VLSVPIGWNRQHIGNGELSQVVSNQWPVDIWQ